MSYCRSIRQVSGWLLFIFFYTSLAIFLTTQIAYATDPPGATFQAGAFTPPSGWDVVEKKIAFHEKSGDAFNLDRSLEIANPLETHKMQFVCLLGLSPYELTMGMLVDVSWNPEQVVGGCTFPLKIAMTPINLDTPEIQSNYGFEMWAKQFRRSNIFEDYETENTYTIPNVPDLGLRIRVDGTTPLNGQQLSGDDSLDFLNLKDLIPSGDEGTSSEVGGGDVEFPIDIPLNLTGGLRITGDEAKADIYVTGMYNSDGTVSNFTTIRYIENLRWCQEGTWTIDIDVPTTAQEGQCLKLSIENLLYLIRMEKRMGMEIELFGFTVSSKDLNVWEYVGQWYIKSDMEGNKIEIPIPVTQGAADLSVSPQDVSFTFENIPGISGAPHTGDPAVLDLVTAHVKITNQSKTPLPADPFKKLLTIYVDNLPVASTYLTSGFASKETKTFSIPFWVMSKGTKTVKVQVNPEQTLGEIFDENNIAETQLNVTAKWGSIELWLKNSQGSVLQPEDVLDMDSQNQPRIYAAERYSIGAALYRGAIQSDGKVKFDLPAGLYSIFVRTKENVNYLDTSAEVNLHEATGVVPHVLTEIVLPTMASITGRVLDKRTSEPIPPAPPIPGSTEERPATIFMGVYSDACDSEGLFNLTKIFPGTYTLRIEHPFYYAKEISVNLQPGQNLNLGDILMVRDGVFDTTGHITLEAASGGGGSIYTNSRTVKISAWAEDINGIAGMKFANDGEDWGTEITSCPTTWTLRDEDGNRTVSVRFKDGAGNWSAIFSASIRLDRQGPTGSVVINNGDETTDQNNVVLTFGATDPADGTVAAVSLSNDGVNWSSPMPYIEPIVWPLSGGYGLKTVYAKFLDACGNWSSVVSDSIEVLPIASISLENSAGLPITTFTNENTVYARVNTGIFAESPRQTQDFSGDSSASETTAAAQSFVPHNSVTICGTRLVGMKNTSSEGFLVVELRVAPQGSTIASSPENSALVAYGMTSSTAIKSNPMPGPVDIVFGSPVTLEADRVYFLVAKAKPYSIGEPIPEIVFFGAWLWPDGNGNVQDAYPDGKLWIASISSDVYTWASPDTEGDFPERHDLAFYLMLPANEMRYTASNNIPSSIETPWGPFASYVNIALPEGDGRKTVAFQLKHPSYLPLGESEILLASAVKDMTNPEVSWIIPGEHQVINGRWVIESDNLYLAVNAQDVTSGVKGIRVGLSGIIDNLPWLDYCTYASSSMIYPGYAKLNYTLPVPDAPYDICLHVRDTAGNMSSVTIPILKDQFVPSVNQFQITPKATMPDGTPCVNRRDVKVSIAASDDGAGIVAYRLGAAQNMSTTWVEVTRAAEINLSTLYNLMPGDGYKNVYLQVKDATEKVTCVSTKVYLRTSGPAAPVLVQWADQNDYFDKHVTAMWSMCTDPVGVTYYQIQIASDPDFTSVLVTKTFDQSTTSYSWTAPSGSGTYYFRVRAQNAASFWSEWTKSNGLLIMANSIGEAKLSRDGQPVILSGVVTASFEDCFYIESEDRTAGIRVEPGCGININTQVTVQGVMGTTQDFERVVIGEIVSTNGTLVLKPIGMLNKTLGGNDWNYDPITGMGQRGVVGGSGLNNIGLLVKIWGWPFLINEKSFLLNDGSLSVLCTVPKGMELNPSWQFVEVTGISSCYYNGTQVERLIRVRDIQPIFFQ